MRKLGIVLALLLCFSFTSCAAGPHQLQRSVDDWDREMYVESPWLNAVLWVVPLIPLAHFGAAIGDFVVTDAYAFWIEDAFTGGNGTGFEHATVDQPDRSARLRQDRATPRRRCKLRGRDSPAQTPAG